mmetsp:Transcript_21922/g.32585  ORF Transcript_21922/g.32585 Transcript_21922/m.32585 type:complete len:201 (+) Transcript_21922:268-870(+)
MLPSLAKASIRSNIDGMGSKTSQNILGMPHFGFAFEFCACSALVVCFNHLGDMFEKFIEHRELHHVRSGDGLVNHLVLGGVVDDFVDGVEGRCDVRELEFTRSGITSNIFDVVCFINDNNGIGKRNTQMFTVLWRDEIVVGTKNQFCRVGSKMTRCKIGTSTMFETKCANIFNVSYLVSSSREIGEGTNIVIVFACIFVE